MATKLTQAVVDKIRHDQEAGAQVYDAAVSGLRIVVGRTDEVSLKSARERAQELRTVLRRGEDPRAPKAKIRT